MRTGNYGNVQCMLACWHGQWRWVPPAFGRTLLRRRCAHASNTHKNDNTGNDRVYAVRLSANHLHIPYTPFKLNCRIHTMSSFVNQAAQQDVMYFNTDCLRTQPWQFGVGGGSSSGTCDAFPFPLSCEALEQPVCGLLEGPLRDQWELHHTVQITDTPAAYSFGHVVGLAALDMVQPKAELDVAGVGLLFANWMAIIAP